MTAFVEISCRTSEEGGDIDPMKAWLSLPALRGTQHLIFLIHGYNNTLAEAKDAYQSLDQFQRAQAGAGRDWAFGATVVPVFWPGDARWGLLRPTYYPFALPKADQTADILGEILTDLLGFAGGMLTVDLVAHSMGNRIGLRMQSLVAGTAGLLVRRSVHMASAVPTRRLERAADGLSRGLDAETREGKAASLYSEDDGVIAYAFPVGETADFPDEGVLPVALGHCDWPLGHGRTNFTQWNASPAGHHDYWFGKAAQIEVHDVLDLGVVGPRELVSHDTPAAPPMEPRELAVRLTQSRGVGDDLAGI